jgi:hypothetical protein
LNTDQIEIIKTSKEKVGTSITIEIEKDLLFRLKNSQYSFDKWYLLENPIVIYNDNTGTFTKLGREIKSPGYSDELNSDWKILEFEGYNKIIWTFNEDFWNSKNGSLLCNGIVIPEEFDSNEGWDRKHQKWIHDIKLPFISVFDFNGILPLNLSRNKLDGVLPFLKELQTEIYKDLLAKLLTTTINYPMSGDWDMKNKYFFHPAIGKIPIIFSKNGFILKTNFFLNKNFNKTLLEFSPKNDFKKLFNFDIKDSFIYLLDNTDFSMTDYQYHINIYNYSSGAKMFLDKIMYKKLFDRDYNRYPLTVRKNHKLISSNENNVEVTYNFKNSKFTLTELNENTLGCNYIVESKVGEITGVDYLLSSNIFDRLQDYFFKDDEIIPYEIEKRKKKFSLLFNELDYYIKKYID